MIPWPLIRSSLLRVGGTPLVLAAQADMFEAGYEGVPDPNAKTEPCPPPTPGEATPTRPGHPAPPTLELDFDDPSSPIVVEYTRAALGIERAFETEDG